MSRAEVQFSPLAAAADPAVRPTSRDFSEIYDTWFHEVARWARALGCPEADLEDLTQEVFIVVQRTMKRLREEVPSDPRLARLAEATRALSPLDRSEAMQRRVRAALNGGTTRARPRLALRPAVAAITILGSVAVASAMFARSWVERQR